VRVALVFRDPQRAAATAAALVDHDVVVEADLARALAARPELLVLDDDATLARVRRHDSDLPVLIVTPTDDVAARVRALRAGADDALAAPFHAAQMRSTAARSISSRSRRRATRPRRR
jgi:two-component system, OmpR family, response regulator